MDQMRPFVVGGGGHLAAASRTTWSAPGEMGPANEAEITYGLNKKQQTVFPCSVDKATATDWCTVLHRINID